MSAEYADLVWRDQAVADVLDVASRARTNIGSDSVPLAESAGRHLASPIDAESDLPPADIATMDGYAIDATDTYPLSITAGEIFPEDESPTIGSGEAARIATGAPLPQGANAVLKRELATVSEGELTGPALDPGTYTYERGSNVAAGERLFEAGERLTAKDAIFLADLGYESVDVYAPFSVGLLATGTEIHEGEHTDLDSPMLAGLLRQWGHDPTYEGSVPDERTVVRDRLATLADQFDVVITTGGTSVGHKDHVIDSLEELGTIHFHRVRLRPGKPLAVATLENGTVAIAIPGKPVGAYTIATLVVRPFFTGRTALPSVSATFSTDLELGTEGFEYAIPVTVDDDQAVPLGHETSSLKVYDETYDPSVLSSSTRATRADGFVLRTEALSAGERVDVIPYPVVE